MALRPHLTPTPFNKHQHIVQPSDQHTIPLLITFSIHDSTPVSKGFTVPVNPRLSTRSALSLPLPSLTDSPCSARLRREQHHLLVATLKHFCTTVVHPTEGFPRIKLPELPIRETAMPEAFPFTPLPGHLYQQEASYGPSIMVHNYIQFRSNLPNHPGILAQLVPIFLSAL